MNIYLRKKLDGVLRLVEIEEVMLYLTYLEFKFEQASEQLTAIRGGYWCPDRAGIARGLGCGGGCM